MFTWRRLFSVRNRAVLMVGLPLLSLLSAFTPMFTQTASAVSPEDVLNRARAWSILNAIIDHRGLIDSTLSNQEVDDCDIFGPDDNDAVYVGAAVTGNPDAGEQSWENVEGNTGILNGALASVGIERGCRGLLEAIGYTSNGDGLQQPGDFGNRLSARIRAALDANAFFGANIGDDRPSSALSYALLYYNLTQVCDWSYRNSYTDNSNPTNKSRNEEAKANGWSGADRNRHYHTYTYEQGKAGENTYYKGGGREDYVRVGSKTGFASSGSNDATISCGRNNSGDVISAKLADNHRFADAYARLLKPGGDMTPGTCLDRYEGRDSELRACDEGFRNRGGDPQFCEKKYPAVPIQDTNASLREACAYGLQTATGDSSQTTPPPGTGNGEGEDRSSCRVEGIGWMICPVFNFLAKITDATYSIIKGMLTVQPLNTTGESGLFNSWSIMRNFANVAFVIVFMVIIFSQITGAGISNYGIKKMLPRLVVAAILVNVSYWICAIAVDLSNILGTSLYTLLTNIQADAGIPQPQTTVGSTGNEFWTFVVGGALGAVALGTAFYVTLAVLLPMLIVVLATILTVFLALILRQALIIILIVLSPLAFVAYLLPNTESLFQKWRSFLQILLLMYPIIALLFGGAALASTIIMTSSEEWYIQIAGAAAAIIPLAAAPTFIGAFNRFAGRFGLPKVGFKFDRTKKAAGEYRDYRKDVAKGRRLEGRNMFSDTGKRIRGDGSSRFRRITGGIVGGVGAPGAVGSFGARTSLKSELKRANAQKAVTEAKQSYAANKIADEIEADKTAGGKGESDYAKAIAGPTGNVSRVQAAAITAQRTEMIEAVKNAQTMLRAEIPPGNLEKVGEVLADAIKVNDSTKAQAAQNILMTSGSGGLVEYRKTMTDIGEENAALMQNQASVDMRKNILENHAGVKANAADFIAQAAQGTTMKQASESPGSWKMSDNELVRQKPASIELAVKSGAVSKERAAEIMNNSELYDNLERNIQDMLTDWATSPVTNPADLPHFQPKP